MRIARGVAALFAACGLMAVAVSHRVAAAPAGGGTIKGHIRLRGKLPGNSVIRMGMDPMCAQANRGTQVVQETAMASADGSLANVFVELQDKLPPTPVPATPVTIDQKGCVYRPRVVGARVGQTLQIRNSDAWLHNVHSLSSLGNTFNVGQPKDDMVYPFKLKDVEVMLRLKCDVHSWMTAFVGVVTQPYFAVSGNTGTFEIDNVPAGSHTIQAWQERYGALKQTVKVTDRATATVEFTYTGAERPPTAGLQDVTLPPGVLTATLIAPSGLQ